MSKTKLPKLYVVTKMVFANSAAEAIRLEKDCPVDEVNLEKEWHIESTRKKIDGFKT